MNTINDENEAASDSSSSLESWSVVTDESSTSSSSSYEDEDLSNKKGMVMMKKVKKLRSMKLARFPSLKLITRQLKIQPDYSSLLSSDAASSEQSTPLKMLHLSPSYMKTTNSSDAKKDTVQKSSITLIKRSCFKPGKSLTRLSSTRYRNSLTRRASGGTDLKKKKARKSRSITLVNQHSIVSDTPTTLKPTNARNSQASPCDSVTCLSSNLESRTGNTGLKNSLASSGNKSMRVMTRTTTLRPLRILTKVASLRTKRPSIKRSSEIPDPSVHRATCASALKESKFPDNLGLQRGENESKGITAMKVCPYSYCSLHGHRHSSDIPPLKRFVSMRRRQLKSQKSTGSKSWSGRQKRSGNTNKGTGDALILGTAHESDSVSIREPTAEQSPQREETNENPAGDDEFNTAENGEEFSSETSSEEKQKPMGLWGLIYKHMASGIAAAEEDSLRTRDEVDRNEVEDSILSDQSMNVEDHERSSINSKLYQYNAIKLVQEAFDKIFSEIPDQSSDDKLIDVDASARMDVSEDNHSEDEKLSTSTSPNSDGDNAAQDQEKMLHPVSKSDPGEGEEAEPTTESKSRQQAPKSWSNLKKVIILRRFVKSLEKVRNFIPRKPRYLPLNHGRESENVNLRRQEMLGRKASEEWMLDYALQNVISTLAPAQRRKVALLVQAFETVAPLPDMSNLSHHVEASPQATPAQNSTEWQDEKDNESKKQINFGVLRKTPRHDLDIKKDQNEGSQIQTVEPTPASCSDISEANYGSNMTRVGSLTTKIVVRDQNEEVASPSSNNGKNYNSLEGVQAESADSDLMETESKLCCKPSPKSADIQIPSSEELSENREVIKVETKPALEDHDCGLSNHDKEPRQVISPCAEQSEEINSQAILNADAHSSASESTLQGRSSEATVEETNVKNKIIERFSNLLEESKSIKTTGAELENQLQKQKNMRMWFMIYKHMATGTATALKQAGEDYTEKDSIEMVGMPDAPSHDPNTVNHDPVDQNIKLQQIEALRLVEEAIDGIQLPEIQDDSPEDQSVATGITPDNDHLDREFIQDRELLISSPAGSIKEEDRTTLDVEEPSSASSNVIYQGKTEGLKKAGNETKPAMKNWSNLKKIILLRRFVKSLEKVKKFTPRGPRFLPLDPDKEAEKINLRHQDVYDRKNTDEWMLDYALQQAVAKLTPARKRKVALLVEAFETVIPTIEN